MVGDLGVRWDVAQVLPLEEEVNFCETRSVRRVAFPALAHQVVDLARAGCRSWEIPLTPVVLVPVVRVLYDLFAGQFCIRLLGAKHQDLPQSDRKGPHVAFCGLFTLKQKKKVLDFFYDLIQTENREQSRVLLQVNILKVVLQAKIVLSYHTYMVYVTL